MPPIRLLSPRLANQIAAGEVVEKAAGRAVGRVHGAEEAPRVGQ